MTEFIESFFDDETKNFKLWSKKDNNSKIDPSEIIYESIIYKINRKLNITKKRYFVLTKDKIYYLKNKNKTTIQGSMDTQWVRVEYSEEENEEKEERFIFRFIKNMKFCDFIIKNKEEKDIWKTHFSKILIQSDFHRKFNAIKMIGKGSFARVYLVENENTGKKFAVKAFSKDYLLSESKGKRSLINEISIMKSISHKNVIKLEEIHESKNSIYLVLELLQGGELFDQIKNNNKNTKEGICQTMKGILNALNHLEKKGIMHRDLKPENIILKDKGDLEDVEVKIVDFGLAAYCEEEEYLFKKCGTPGYVAPEIIRSSRKDNVKFTPKVDVFSAGVIFYVLFLGKSPFKGKSFNEVLKLNKKCNIDFKCDKFKKNPEILDLLQKMLMVNPEERISARQALNHKFFKEYQNSSDMIDIDLNDLKNLNEKLMNNEINQDSFVVGDNPINGKTNTVRDNSEGGIDSFKNMKKGDKKIVGIKKRNKPRASIYKEVLKNQLDKLIN